MITNPLVKIKTANQDPTDDTQLFSFPKKIFFSKKNRKTHIFLLGDRVDSRSNITLFPTEAKNPLRIQIGGFEVMAVDSPGGDRWPHLPHVVHTLHLLRNLNLREDSNHPSNLFAPHVPHLERQLPGNNDAVWLQVKRLHGHRAAAAALERSQHLRPLHANTLRINPPGDPPAGARRRRVEGHREGGVGGVVGPVEEGVEHGEV